MPEFVQFIASEPSVVPATAEKVYDKYWLSAMRVEAGDPTKAIKLVAVFTPARDMVANVPVLGEDGKPTGETQEITYKELQKNVEPKRLVIGDVFKVAMEDVEFAITMNKIFEILNNKATAAGVL